MNHETYFAGPVYGSTKSTFTVRYFTPYDMALMQSFDTNPEILDFFQPLMAVLVKFPDGREERVKIDFWLWFKGGLSVWLHVAEPGTAADDQLFVLARAGCPGNCVFSVVWPPGVRMQEIQSGH